LLKTLDPWLDVESALSRAFSADAMVKAVTLKSLRLAAAIGNRDQTAGSVATEANRRAQRLKAKSTGSDLFQQFLDLFYSALQ